MNSIQHEPATTPNKLFDQGLTAHLAGDLVQAQNAYEIYLELCASLPVVRTNLAAIYLNQGRLPEAEHLLSLALHEAPTYSEALSNRGYLQLLRGHPDDALADFERALAGNPAVLAALTNLVPLYSKRGRQADAQVLLDRALELQPLTLGLHDLKAQLLQSTEGSERAIAYLEQLSPRFEGRERAALHSIRARLMLHACTDLPATLAALEAAIEATPEPALEDLINKGEVLRRLGRQDEAFAWVNLCLLSQGERGGLLNLKACILQGLGQVEEALTLYRMAIAAEPFNALFYANQGFLLIDRGAHQQAIEAFSQALAFAPQAAALHHGMAQAHFHLGKPALAYQHYRLALDVEPDNLNIWDNFLYFLSFVNTLPSQQLLEHCHAYASQALEPRLLDGLAVFEPAWSDPRQRPLRIGIISAEIGSHCVSFFLLSLLQGARPEQAEFYLFPSKDRSTEPRWQIFRDLARHFEPIDQLSDQEACARIRSLNLDVVLETTQHMVANRLTLMARRLAPVQAHYIGMHGTTAVPAIDHFIGDAVVTPPEFAPQFTEQLLRLPRTWVCYTPPEAGLPPIRPSDPSAPLRLGSFNNVSKISRDCLRLWATVLLALPEARLVIKDSLRNGELDHQRNLITYLSRRGIAPERVQILPRTAAWEEHMDLYNDLDIALDTTPLTSGTTAFDALLMGVPLVACSSDWIGGRLSASIVQGLGQPDWIAATPEAYGACVRSLASDLEGLRAGRQARREQFLASDLCDQEGLAAALVAALREAYLARRPSGAA